MLISSVSLEKLAIRTLCSAKPAIKLAMAENLTKDDFYFEPAKEIYNRVAHLLKTRGVMPEWGEVLNDPVIAETTRKMFRTYKKRPLDNKEKIVRLAAKLNEFTKIRGVYEIEQDIGKAIKGESVDINALLKKVSAKADGLKSGSILDTSAYKAPGIEKGKLEIPKYIVRGLLPETSRKGTLVGASYTGKTYVCMELAMCLATGEDFMGLPVKQGGTLILAAEAEGDIPYRYEAAVQGREKRTFKPKRRGSKSFNLRDLPIRYRAGVPNLSLGDNVQMIISEIKLIVSDVLRPAHFQLAQANRRMAAVRRFGSSDAWRRSL